MLVLFSYSIRFHSIVHFSSYARSVLAERYDYYYTQSIVIPTHHKNVMEVTLFWCSALRVYDGAKERFQEEEEEEEVISRRKKLYGITNSEREAYYLPNHAVFAVEITSKLCDCTVCHRSLAIVCVVNNTNLLCIV